MRDWILMSVSVSMLFGRGVSMVKEEVREGKDSRE
jgi:hypothetical protein